MTDGLSEAMRMRDEKQAEERIKKIREITRVKYYSSYRFKTKGPCETREQLAGAIVAAGEATWGEMSQILANDDGDIFQQHDGLLYKGRIYSDDFYGLQDLRKAGLANELNISGVPQALVGYTVGLLQWSKALDALKFWMHLQP